MRGRKVRFTVAVAALLATIPATALGQAGRQPCPAGTSPDPAGLVCVLLDKAAIGLAAQTQQAATAQAVAAHESSWLGQALELQHRLGDALPLRDAMWVGTHNSFNTVSNTPVSVSNLDSNQHISMLDQLRLGVRSLELDVHWFPSVLAGGAKAPVVCHARPPSELNAGCTIEKLLPAELVPIGTWLREPAHRGDVVLLYIEDHIDEAAGYQAAAKAFADVIGDLIYQPPAGSACPLLPLDLRRADVLAAGKQVVVMSGCGGANGAGAWHATVFDDNVRAEEGNPQFSGYPSCSSSSVSASDYGSALVRFYEDSTFVSAVTGLAPGQRFTAAAVRDMVRCGTNLFGLDQVDPFDPNLDAMVWSWAPGAPNPAATGQCAVQGSAGRFLARPCDAGLLQHACLDAAGDWFVTAAVGTPDGGAAACAGERPGASFAVPRNGKQQQLLSDAKAAAGVAEVWVAYRQVAGVWT
jgi:hypothetical protein